MAGLALPRAVLLLPVIMVRGWERRCFRHHIWRRFRKTVWNFVQLALVRLTVHQCACGQGGNEQRREFEGLAVPVDHHCATPRSLPCTGWWWTGVCERSYARTGSCTGVSGALPALRTN